MGAASDQAVCPRPATRAARVGMPVVLLRERLARSAGGRTPEPMVMDEPQSVAEFHEAGADVNLSVYEFCARNASRLLPRSATVLDLGCGSGRYLAHLARHRPDISILGLDLAEPMLATGRELLESEGLRARVELRTGDMTDFAARAPDGLAMVSCVFALHHLPSRDLLDRCLAQIARVRQRTGCAVWIFDFCRLKRPDTYARFLRTIGGFTPTLERDAIVSERASFGLYELREALGRAGLEDLEGQRDRLLGAWQIQWAPARNGAPTSDDAWHELPLPASRRREATRLGKLFSRAPAG